MLLLSPNKWLENESGFQREKKTQVKEFKSLT